METEKTAIEVLEQCNYSREEIALGVKAIAKSSGMEALTEIFDLELQ